MKTFEIWLSELEGYSLKGERAYDELVDYPEKVHYTAKQKWNVIYKWLKAAFQAGVESQKMKPTTKQIKVIEFLEQQLSFWKNSNDIRSPTHIGDINAFLELHTDIFTEDELENIDSLTSELYFSIMRIE